MILDHQISIRYRHLHFNDELLEQIQSELSGFKQKLPAKSVLQASFVRDNNLIKATLHVFSPAGPLFTSAIGNSVHETCSLLVSNLARRADKWKTKRRK